MRLRAVSGLGIDAIGRTLFCIQAGPDAAGRSRPVPAAWDGSCPTVTARMARANTQDRSSCLMLAQPSLQRRRGRKSLLRRRRRPLRETSSDSSRASMRASTMRAGWSLGKTSASRGSSRRTRRRKRRHASTSSGEKTARDRSILFAIRRCSAPARRALLPRTRASSATMTETMTERWRGTSLRRRSSGARADASRSMTETLSHRR